jgi:hypothetical protein
MLMMGLFWIRQATEGTWRIVREDVKTKPKINANDDVYNLALAA